VGEGAVAIMDEITRSRSVLLKDMIGSLSIPSLGRRQAEIMIKQGVDTLEKFFAMTAEELAKLDGFAATKAKTVVDGIRAARPLIEKMASILTLEAPREKTTMTASNKLAGMAFCFTGKIERVDEAGNRYTRDMMHQTVLANGGSVTDRVAKGTTLVQADPSSKSTKTQKAEKVGATIMSEADFWKLVA
jgi:DNA ligase (NAD+)